MDTEYEDFLTKGRLVAIVAVSVVFLGLVIWGTTRLFKQDQLPTPVEQPPVVVVPTVSAEKGGEVTADDGAKIIVPPGALEKDEILQIRKTADGDVIDEYDLLPDGLKFKKAVTVILPYDEEAMKKAGKTFRPRVSYDHTGIIAPFTIDRVAKTVRISIKTF